MVAAEPTNQPSTELTLDDLDAAAVLVVIDHDGRVRTWTPEGVDQMVVADALREVAHGIHPPATTQA